MKFFVQFRWDDDFTMPDVAKSVVGHFRHALDILRPEQVISNGVLFIVVGFVIT